MTGFTDGAGFPVKAGYQTTPRGSADLFVTLLDPAVAGTASLLYSTYLGGSDTDKGNAITADSAGRLYVTGYAKSSTFPTVRPFQAAKGSDKDVVVAQLDPAQSGTASLRYSPFLGGGRADEGTSIALGSADKVYLTGFTSSTNFPVAAALDGSHGGGTCGTAPCQDAFVTQLDLAGNRLVYSTYLGRTGTDIGYGLVVDGSGAATVVGMTKAADFPVVAALQASKGSEGCSAPPCADVFVSTLSGSGSTLGFSTYLGGSKDD